MNIERIDIAGLPVERAAPPPGAHGRALLFVHGVLAGSWIWRNFLPHFAARGYDAHAINLRGHGLAGTLPGIGALPFAAYVEDVLAVARALPDPVLVGHSMGGMAVQKAAESLDPTHAALLCSAPPRGVVGIPTAGMVRAALRHLPEVLFGRPFLLTRAEMDDLGSNRMPPADRAEVHARMTPESGRHLRDLALPGVPVDPRRLTGRILVVAGGRDRTLPPSYQRPLAHRYGADYREYPDRGHLPMLEPGWLEVARDLAGWLAAAGAPHAARAAAPR